MENNINYREEIQKLLQWIPEEYLASLYQVISLMAKSFQKEESKLSKEVLQAYADKFRKAYSLVMNKDVGLNFSYQIQENFTILKVYFPNLAEQKNELKEEWFDLEQLCDDNQVEIIYDEEKQKYELKYLEEIEEEIQDKHSDKLLIFTENAEIHFIDTSEAEKWQTDKASDDARNLFALMLQIGDMHHKTKIQQAV